MFREPDTACSEEAEDEEDEGDEEKGKKPVWRKKKERSEDWPPRSTSSLPPFYSSPDLGVAVEMEREEVAFTSSTLLPVPGLFVKNPLLRLASKSSIKLLFGSEMEKKEVVVSSGAGVTAPYYPIFLPIDQDFKAKYIWHHRMAKRGRGVKERTYSFLEHPVGWIGFVYHFSV